MRSLIFLSSIILLACNSNTSTRAENDKETAFISRDTPANQQTAEVEDNNIKTEEKPEPKDENSSPDASLKKYSNTRFRNVTAEKVSEGKYRIKGQGQIFEANFGWVVEDGHNQLKRGFTMTDAGAPAWGNFDFTIDVKKQRDNSTLTLILFETSAKDGSNVHELPIPLK